MITSRIVMQSGILQLLSDPTKIKKQLDDLVLQEKKTKAELKKLQEAKSLKAYKEQLDKEIKQNKADLQEVQGESANVLHEAKAAAESVQKECKERLNALQDREKAVSAREAGCRAVERSVATKLSQAEKAEKLSKDTLEKAQELKLMYETKLMDLKNRFSGLV